MRLVLTFIASGLFTLNSLAQFPHPPPIADANPALREEREVWVPTVFKAPRNVDVMVIKDDNDTLKPIKLSVGSKMVLGMTSEVYVYPVGGVRPDKPWTISQGGLPAKGSGSSAGYYYPEAPGGLLRRGKPCIVEMDITIFETDIPGQHMWMPHSPKYKVLWRTTLRQTVKEKVPPPDEIQKPAPAAKP